MSSRIYCTYCDHRYLSRALALFSSMETQGYEGEFWLFCLSNECDDAVTKLDLGRIRTVRMAQLESFYPELLTAKANREPIEYYYTCTPAIIGYTMSHAPDAEWVTFLDSDLWFFESPDRVFETIGDVPAVIVPHRFSPRLQGLNKFGIYNVGWVSFRRNEEGLRCLEWWRVKCLEWCFGWIDGDRYADQKYLDNFSNIAPHTEVLNHKGCNLAPWNIENYAITCSEGKVRVDDEPLVFFHFHGIRRSLHYFFFDNHRFYGAQHTRLIRNQIYRIYVQSLLDAEDLMARNGAHSWSQPIKPPGGQALAGIDFKQVIRTVRRNANQTIDLLQGWPIVAYGNRAC